MATWNVGNANRPRIRIELPEIGGKVKGVYHGVPFAGTLRIARFHGYCGDLIVHVDTDGPFVVYGVERDGLSMQIGPDSDPRLGRIEVA